jgi:hypothetical protein
VTPLGARAKEALAAWAGAREFDWEAVLHKYKGLKTLEFAIWHEEALCAVGVVTVAGESVTLKYVEGQHSPCPLGGLRVPIALEVATCYAQVCDRRVLRIQPIKQTLIEKCQFDWGFVPDPSAVGHYRKEV